jgi:hypothetical protein
MTGPGSLVALDLSSVRARRKISPAIVMLPTFAQLA